MHQIRFRLGLRTRPAGAPHQTRWGNSQRSPDPLAGFKGPTSKGRGGKGKGRERRKGRGGEGREGKGREGEGEGGKGGEEYRHFLQYTLSTA